MVDPGRGQGRERQRREYARIDFSRPNATDPTTFHNSRKPDRPLQPLRLVRNTQVPIRRSADDVCMPLSDGERQTQSIDIYPSSRQALRNTGKRAAFQLFLSLSRLSRVPEDELLPFPDGSEI
ncbi:hypothetical protein GCM10027186_30200 [Micromonospora schwarzwaldensis]